MAGERVKKFGSEEYETGLFQDLEAGEWFRTDPAQGDAAGPLYQKVSHSVAENQDGKRNRFEMDRLVLKLVDEQPPTGWNV